MSFNSSSTRETKQFSSRLRQPVATITVAKPRKPSNGSGCCRKLNDLTVLGSIVSQRNHPSNPKIEQQVEELENEIQKLKDENGLYLTSLERTKNYLRYCLEMAQENGMLDIISNNNSKDNKQECLHTFDMVQAANRPQTLPLVHHHRDLAALVDQAKIDGWYLEPYEVERHEKVGRGTTADVYRGTWRGLEVGVKCLYPDFFHSNERGVSFFAQEVETLSRQRHPFVLRLLGACLDPPDRAWIVTEFMGTTLKEWLHGPGSRRKQRVVPLPPLEERVARGLEIAQAMQYLHQHKPVKIIHRDLKPSNIFMDDNLHVRVADFGHARFLKDEEKALTGETGTHVYMAPEVIRCEPYNEKSDVYSFGVVLNELITGDYPYIDVNYGPCKVAMEVAEGRLRPALPKDEDHQLELEEIIELIKVSWDGDAARRPSFAAITYWLKNIQQSINTDLYPADFVM